jgi:Terminase large subunit, T4likevirus-type, N-terminal
MTIDDVEHYSDDEKQKIIASYPAHEAEARVKGIPLLGSGRVFPVAEEGLLASTETFRRTGPVSAGWTSVGTTRSRLWNWFGTVMRTLFMFLARIG